MKKHSQRYPLLVSALIMALLVPSSLFGCTLGWDYFSAHRDHNSEQADGTVTKQIKVVTSVFATYDFARQLLGEAGEVTMLMDPGIEVHSFEPTVRTILTLQQAEVFVYVGGESEAWIDSLLASIDTSHMRVVRLADHVNILDEADLEGISNSRDAGRKDDADFDEHIWTSPVNAKRIVQVMAQAFREYDPSRSVTITKAEEDYVDKLDALDARFRSIVDQAHSRVLVIGDRFPLRYFAKEYQLTCYAAFSGCSSATEASAQTIAFLINKMREESIPVVFFIELSTHRIADTICEETGAEALLFHSCQTVSRDDYEAGVSYLGLMGRNADNLERALR